MPFFGELFGMREENDVVLVLTWRNLVNVKEMLGAVPFKDAVPSDMEQRSEHPQNHPKRVLRTALFQGQRRRACTEDAGDRSGRNLRHDHVG